MNLAILHCDGVSSAVPHWKVLKKSDAVMSVGQTAVGSDQLVCPLLFWNGKASCGTWEDKRCTTRIWKLIICLMLQPWKVTGPLANIGTLAGWPPTEVLCQGGWDPGIWNQRHRRKSSDYAASFLLRWQILMNTGKCINTTKHRPRPDWRKRGIGPRASSESNHGRMVTRWSKSPSAY
jgi:hypothetical protein